MDTQERHELKENELAEFFSNFGEWWAKYGNALLLVLVIAAGSFAAYRLYHNWSRTSVELAFADLAGTATVDGYASVAEEHRQPAVRTVAYLRGGDMALSEATQPRSAVPQPTEGEPAETPMDRDEALERAEGMYRRAMETGRHPAFRANALLGLAQVAETQGQWDQAASHYREAEEIATGAHLPSLASQARQRQALLERLQQPVVLAPEPAAPEVPAGDPTTDLMQDGSETFQFEGLDDDAGAADQPDVPASAPAPAEPDAGAVEPEPQSAEPADTDEPAESTAPADAPEPATAPAETD